MQSDTLTRRSALSALGAALVSSKASAIEGFPVRTIRIVVPFPAGGASTDGLARAFALEFAKAVNVPVIVENKPGGGTAIAALAVKGQPADGHTLLFQSDGLYNAKVATPGLPYEASEFEIISPLGLTNYALVVPADRKWRVVHDLRDLKRELNVGTLGIGVSSYSILTKRMCDHLGIGFRMIPYKGGVEGVSAVIAGEIDAYFATVGLTQTIKYNPKIRVLAYTGEPSRKGYFTGVPTFHELGMHNMVFNSYYGLAIRSNTPASIKAELSRAARKVADSAEMKAARQTRHLEDYIGSTEAYRGDVLRMFQIYADAMKLEESQNKNP
jgi:tripartite-type tricarboxylate transporter receptor subunit TctC